MAPVNSNNFGRYAAGGTRPVNEMGHTTPAVELSDSQRPAVAFVPAPYLPAGRFDEHKRANIVLSAGTPVALDAAGSLVPAGTPVGHAFEYSALDTNSSAGAGRNGLPAVKKAADGTAVTAAGTSIMASGLGGDRLGFFLQPVGIVAYNAFQFEGSVGGTWPNYTVDYDNPANFPLHNTQAQPETLVSINCDYAIEVPYIWGRNLLSDTVKIFDNTANEMDVLGADAKSYPFAHDELVAASTTTAVFGSGVKLVFISPANGTGDTGLAGSGVIGGNSGAATYAAAGGSAGTAVDVTTEGYHVLYDGTDTTKYIVVKTEAGATADGFTTGTINFQGAALIQPGDYVACRLGKFVKYDSARMEPGDMVGQVLRRRTSAIKLSYLDRVKTAYDRSSNPVHRLPGSATRGVPYLISLVTDAAQVSLEKKQSVTTGTTLTAAGLPTSLPLGSIVINILR